MCWDIVAASENSSDPVRVLISRYLSWQKMMNSVGKGTMSFRLQKGLLGELLYFEKVLQSAGISYAINSWTGPDGSDQDFIFDSSWAEIKTVALAAETVHISSIEQLTQSSNGLLIVYFLEKSVPRKGKPGGCPVLVAFAYYALAILIITSSSSRSASSCRSVSLSRTILMALTMNSSAVCLSYR